MEEKRERERERKGEKQENRWLGGNISIPACDAPIRVRWACVRCDSANAGQAGAGAVYDTVSAVTGVQHHRRR